MPNRIPISGMFRQIVEATPGAMMVIDQAGHVVMMNSQAEVAFGFERNEIVGQPIERLVPAWLHPNLRAAFCDPRRLAGCELLARRRDGSEFPVKIRPGPIETNLGPMVLAAIVDLSASKREEARIHAALREKDIVLGEIHHRVKNNLQIIYSLLGLQAARVADRATQDQLRDSQNRIHSMALIHQTLYGSKNFESVDFALFIDTLLPALTRSYGIDPNRIQICVDVEPVRLPIGIAVPCGLVSNELISNALKHAFPGRDHGEIRIALTRQLGNEAMLSVSDDGIGLPDHVDIRKTETIGLQLVVLLADQLGGEVSCNRADPTRLSLRFEF